jgi:hypothetical protein
LYGANRGSKKDKMGAGKNQLRFPLTAVNGIVTETLVNLFESYFFFLQVMVLFKL